MLYFWLYNMRSRFEAAEWLECVTFRGITAAFTAFIVSLAVGSLMIRWFGRKGVVEDTAQPDHAGLNAIQSQKKNVPTIGGLMLIAGIVASVVLWADSTSFYAYATLLCVIGFGAIGFADDYIKLRCKPARGLTKTQKLLGQAIFGLILGWLLFRHMRGHAHASRIYFPFSEDLSFDFGPYYILWAALVLTACSNAANLADGLDGLAAGCSAIGAVALALLAALTSQTWGRDLTYTHVHSSPELCVLALAVVGSCLGFLWYNCHPAQIFMGDTGSLMLGGVLGFIGLALKQDLLLIPVLFVFFIDALAVALQIASYKLTRRRIFPITPIHHYFQIGLKWPEQKITARLWIVAALAALASMAALRMGWQP